MKECNICGYIRPIDQFGLDKKTNDGRYYQCKLCRNQHLSELRATSEWRENLRQYRSRDDVKEKRKLYEVSPSRVKARRISLSKVRDIPSLSRNQFLTHLYNWAMIVKYGKNCACCKEPADEAHHILYKSKYPQLMFNENNGIPLCITHHNEVHRCNP